MTLSHRVDPEFRLTALKWLSDYVKTQYDKARDELAPTLRRGAKLPGRSPVDDRKVGTVSLSDPDPQVLISDESVLTDWYQRHYPDHVEHIPAIVGDHEEAIAVLARYAPHLVADQPRIRKWALDELKSVSAARGVMCGPGGEMDVPGAEISPSQPRLTVTTSKDADDIMRDLIVRNLLTVDGQIRAIEGA